MCHPLSKLLERSNLIDVGTDFVRYVVFFFKSWEQFQLAGHAAKVVELTTKKRVPRNIFVALQLGKIRNVPSIIMGACIFSRIGNRLNIRYNFLTRSRFFI